MTARCQYARAEDNPASKLEKVIILAPEPDAYDPVLEFVKSAGFRVREWEDRQIIVYGKAART